MSDANTREPNLLIIRRGGAAELEAPKGGVWKIAYADFMTAMMAFFLVMWLINATSETTKTGVANYFNPIKLADGMQLPKKGLMDPEHEEIEPGADNTNATAEGEAEPADADEAETAEDAEHAEETEHAEDASSEKKARFTEAALFRDPYAVLAAIAAEADATAALVANGGGHGSVGAGAGDRVSDTFGDPFDPAAWQVIAAPAEGDAGHGGGRGGASPAATTAPGGDAEAGLAEPLESPGQSGATAIQTAKPAAGGVAHEQPAAVAGESTTDGQARAAGAGDGATDGQAYAAGAGETGAGERAAGEQAAGETGTEAQPLQEQIAKALETGSGQTPSVSVSNADGGVLISLADQVAFGMFAVGSAEPLPETIAAMEKIAALLNTLPGKVIIRGHTDGRPFKSGDYDNWRLSSARAHMAYHMLVRGGLDESRVERIEGYADRDLKLPDDPDAAENRRIDILVQEIQS